MLFKVVVNSTGVPRTIKSLRFYLLKALPQFWGTLQKTQFHGPEMREFVSYTSSRNRGSLFPLWVSQALVPTEQPEKRSDNCTNHGLHDGKGPWAWGTRIFFSGCCACCVLFQATLSFLCAGLGIKFSALHMLGKRTVPRSYAPRPTFLYCQEALSVIRREIILLSLKVVWYQKVTLKSSPQQKGS